MTTFALNILIVTVILLMGFAIGMTIIELIKTAKFRKEVKATNEALKGYAEHCLKKF